MNRKFSFFLALAALILTGGCKKAINSSAVSLSGKAKAGFAANALWQNPGIYGRLCRYDVGDGNWSDCIVAYDEVSGMTSLTQFTANGSVDLIPPGQFFQTDNAGSIDPREGNSDITDNYLEDGGLHMIPYDATGDQHEDHLLLWVPGHGKAWLMHYNGNGAWHVDWSSTNGIGGYDLAGAARTDKIISYDYGQGAKNNLICYRPGSGFVWFLYNNGGAGGNWTFTSFLQSSSGIAGYDMSNTFDQLVCIGGPSVGNMNLAAYRPNWGNIYLIVHAANDWHFLPARTSTTGLPGFDFMQYQDRIVAVANSVLSPNVPENNNEIYCYRPGYGTSYASDFEWDSPDNYLAGPNHWTYSGGGAPYLLWVNPYGTGTSFGSGDHILSFTAGGQLNTSLLFYTPGYSRQSQLYNLYSTGYTQVY